MVETFHFLPYFLMWQPFFRRRIMQTDILTIKEVSAYLKITEKTAYRLTAEGKIPGFKVGGAWRFRKQEIDAWIDERMKDGGASN